MAGKLLVQKLGGQGRVLFWKVYPESTTGEKQKLGALKAFQETPGIKLVASQTAHWKTEEAFDVFTNILQAHPNLDGVFCANDTMAFGAIQAIEAAAKTGKIQITSYDALLAAREAIKAGTIGCSVDQRPNLMGYISVKYAVDILHGDWGSDLSSISSFFAPMEILIRI